VKWGVSAAPGIRELVDSRETRMSPQLPPSSLGNLQILLGGDVINSSRVVATGPWDLPSLPEIPFPPAEKKHKQVSR
jgi:hypothetical protein